MLINPTSYYHKSAFIKSINKLINKKILTNSKIILGFAILPIKYYILRSILYARYAVKLLSYRMHS